MNTLRRLMVACMLPGAVLASVSVVAGCETRERVVVREPVRERVVVANPPPPVVEEKVIVRP